MPTTTITIPHPGPRARWLAAGLATGLLVAAIASPAFVPRPILGIDPNTQPPEHTISVTGTGRVVLSPDIADVRVGVSITKPTVKAARAAAAESMTRVITALKKLGIADKDLQTTILSLQPIYDYSTGGNPPRLTDTCSPTRSRDRVTGQGRRRRRRLHRGCHEPRRVTWSTTRPRPSRPASRRSSGERRPRLARASASHRRVV